MTRHYFSFSTIFFTEIFSPPVRWVAVAHPLLMRRRATRAWASCSPDLERALSFLCDATWLRLRSLPLANRLPLRCFPTSPLRPPLTLPWARANYSSSIRRVTPFSPPTLHPTPKISPANPRLATSRPPIANRPRCAPFLPPPPALPHFSAGKL